jgi:hypothetical protein
METIKTTQELLKKYVAMDQAITYYRYSNGYMIEVGGRDSEGNNVYETIVCLTIEEVFAVLTALNNLPLYSNMTRWDY